MLINMRLRWKEMKENTFFLEKAMPFLSLLKHTLTPIKIAHLSSNSFKILLKTSSSSIEMWRYLTELKFWSIPKTQGMKRSWRVQILPLKKRIGNIKGKRAIKIGEISSKRYANMHYKPIKSIISFILAAQLSFQKEKFIFKAIEYLKILV